MADTNFTNGETIPLAWIQDVNNTVYRALGAAGTAPTTPAQTLANIGAASLGGLVTQTFNAAPATASTHVTTLAQVQGLITSGTAGVSSWNSRSGAVTMTSGDVTTALGYVPASASAQVSSFNTRTGAVTLTSTDVTTALGYTPTSGSANAFTQLGLTQGAVAASSVAWGAATNQVTWRANPTANYPVGGCLFKLGLAAGTESGWTSNPNASTGNNDFVTFYPYASSSSARTRIWGANPVVENLPGYDASTWAVEANVNNAANASPPQIYGNANHKLGFVFVSGGNYPVTAGFVSTATTTGNSNYTSYYSQNVINQHFWAAPGQSDGTTAFLDSSNASTSFAVAGGSKVTGIDLAAGSATYSSSMGLRLPNNIGVVSKNAAGTGTIVLIYGDPGNNCQIGVHASAIGVNAPLAPTTDNSLNCGSAANRWTAVWAVNGTIQTSDPSLKTDLAPLPEALPLVQALEPKTYRWKVGGKELQKKLVKKKIHEKRVWLENEFYVELIDGKAVQKSREVTREEYLWDEYPVFEEDGSPHMLTMAHGRHGSVTQQAIHRVPRMVEVEVEESVPVDREGKRTHWGFLATDVRDAFAKTGLDFAGYVLGEDGTHHMRPDQLIPVLWKAVQELSAEVEKLKAKL